MNSLFITSPRLSFTLLFILASAYYANSQTRVQVEAKNPNEQIESLDHYFIIYTTGNKFTVTFKNENLSFSDSAHLASYMTKNVKIINGKVAIQGNEKSNPLLYRKAVNITTNLKIYSFRIVE